jgi:hypothetical protein
MRIGKQRKQRPEGEEAAVRRGDMSIEDGLIRRE